MQESPEVQAIRARYAASFTEKSEMIVYCIGLIDDKSGSESNLQEVREHMHKLAGSSGMYGYQDICDAARSSMVHIDNEDCVSLLSDLQQLRDMLLSHV